MAGIIIAGWDPQEGGQVRYPTPTPSRAQAFDPLPTPPIFCFSSQSVPPRPVPHGPLYVRVLPSV